VAAPRKRDRDGFTCEAMAAFVPMGRVGRHVAIVMIRAGQFQQRVGAICAAPAIPTAATRYWQMTATLKFGWRRMWSTTLRTYPRSLSFQWCAKFLKHISQYTRRSRSSGFAEISCERNEGAEYRDDPKPFALKCV
jgi:hypothetical protein